MHSMHMRHRGHDYIKCRCGWVVQHDNRQIPVHMCTIPREILLFKRANRNQLFVPRWMDIESINAPVYAQFCNRQWRKRIHQNRLWFVPGHRNNQLLLWHNDNANIQCGLPIVHGELKGLKMSKKIIVIMGLVLFGFINRANADCTLIGTVYTACKPGYYLALITCKACPTDEKTGVQTTSPDRNTGGITTCYVPSGASGKDDKGTWVYDGNCYYSGN